MARKIKVYGIPNYAWDYNHPTIIIYKKRKRINTYCCFFEYEDLYSALNFAKNINAKASAMEYIERV